MSAEFRQRHMRVIELNENDVASQIRMNHGRELEVVDAALDQILQGLYQFWIKRVCFGHGGAHGRAPLRNNPGLSCGF